MFFYAAGNTTELVWRALFEQILVNLLDKSTYVSSALGRCHHVSRSFFVTPSSTQQARRRGEGGVQGGAHAPPPFFSLIIACHFSS